MRGTWTIGRIHGAPIALHWSLPLGALLFGRFSWAPGFWIAFALLILSHEIGHALVVRSTGSTIVHVLAHGIGGECSWHGQPTRIGRACIAWGGVWAQLLLAAIAFPVLYLVPPTSPLLFEIVAAFTWSNIYLAAINLVPIAGFDGKEAWKLPGLLLERWRSKRSRRPAKRPPAKVLPHTQRVKPFEFPVEDDGPLSHEARRIVDEANEIVRRANRERAPREKKN